MRFCSYIPVIFALFSSLAIAEDKPALGERFSDGLSISFCLPADSKSEVTTLSNGTLGIWTVKDKNWTFSAVKVALREAVAMGDSKDDKGKDVLGLLTTTTSQMRSQGADVFRSEMVKLGLTDVGIIIAHIHDGAKDQLLQQALVLLADRSCCTLTLLSPPPAGDPEKDANTQAAAATFRAILDSMQAIDGAKLRKEQDERLYNTRLLMVNWTREMVMKKLIPEQYLRFKLDGKDMGYAYVTEEPANELPRVFTDPVTKQPITDPVTGEVKRDLVKSDAKSAEGFRIGMRIRTLPEPGKSADFESWMFVTLDRNHEIWKSFQVLHDPTNPAKTRQEVWSSEIGAADRTTEKEWDKNLTPEQLKQFDKNMPAIDKALKDGKMPDGMSLPFRIVERYKLRIRRESVSQVDNPFERSLPPFYIPSAYAAILPRILPLTEPRGYMFASYDPDRTEVILRYIDVKTETDVVVDGKRMRAVPIVDRFGFNGAPTVHYMSPEGIYLGTYNEVTKLLIVPTDRATLTQCWKDANLTRPSVIDKLNSK